MLSRTELRNAIGRREFTVRDFAHELGVTEGTARARIQRLQEAGFVEPTGEVLQHLGDEGRPLRGRPATLYRIS
jgi:predicted ArsR family transcriptional regulator